MNVNEEYATTGMSLNGIDIGVLGAHVERDCNEINTSLTFDTSGVRTIVAQILAPSAVADRLRANMRR